jgi:cytochrome c oxidase subunit 2
MKHLIAAGFLVIVVTLALGFVLTPANLLPDQASLQARPIDQLFSFQFWAISFLFSLIVVFMLYSMIVFRRRKGETGDGVHMHGNTTLEVTWTLIPLGTVIGLAFWGAQILGETMRVDPTANEIEVIASQWSWRFEYPEEGIISSEMVLPVNQQALLLLSSQDVIHSFWVPEFRVKQDALPGGEEMVRELRITPTDIGEYKIRCAELCGRLHTEMLADVRVVSQADYNAWVEEQLNAVSDDPVLRGQKWYTDFGCSACHSVDGSDMVGPTWLGTFGSQETLEDGSTLPVDEAYLLESIRDPAAKIVQGYQNVMPANIAEGMTDEQVQDVIEYIKSLQ